MKTKRPPRPAYEEPIEVYFSSNKVPNAGYTWLHLAEPVGPRSRQPGDRAPENQAPILITHPRTYSVRRYPALKEFPNLYRDFAALAPNDMDAIAQFASRHGWLGVGDLFRSPRQPPPELPDLQPLIMINGEGLGRWQYEIQELALLIHVWDCVARGDVKHLRSFIRYEPGTRRFLIEAGVAHSRILTSNDPIVQSRIAAPRVAEDLPVHLFLDDTGAGAYRYDQPLIETWPAGEILSPARFFLTAAVNQRLRAHVSPRILLSKNGTLTGQTVPKNLLGTLYLQFYQEMTGQITMRKCTVCQHEMNVTGCRTTKRMHDSCRRREQMKRYLAKRKRQAKLDGKTGRGGKSNVKARK